MTLVEFLAPFSRRSRQDKCLAVLYYLTRYEQSDAATVDEVRKGLERARVSGWRKMNVADVLAKSGDLVDSPSSRGNRREWTLTGTGVRHIRNELGLPEDDPEIEHDVANLLGVVGKIKDEDVRSYLEEGVRCLQANALRAAVVFLWSGAIRVLQARLLGAGINELNTELQRHDPKARQVSRIDHFAYVKDKTQLLAAEGVGLLDKGERSTLEEALNLRNRCGHPGKYSPGVKKVSGYVEDLVSVAFS